MELEADVARHYTHGSLEEAILGGLAASGKDTDRLSAADLSAVDEFHLGGRAATEAIMADLRLSPNMQLLDIGSGIGGPARTFAETCGCRVIGIDLTQEFVEVAQSLTRRCGLEDRVGFRQASGLALPFDDARFDAATMLHVGMNIEDKARVFAETRRVLKPGGRFCIYDVMRTGDGALSYPVPWASAASTSFVESAEAYRRLLREAGFTVEMEQSRIDLAVDMMRRMQAQVAAGGPPPLGLHLIMGPEMPKRFGNLRAALEAGIVAPIEMIARSA
jgi:ubiquinone/menaquinone biosynthesis C-methylase UbiE